jgi:hypothetical protein
MTVRTLVWDSTAPILRCRWPFCWIKLPGCSDCDRQLKWSTYRRRLAFLGCMAAGILFLSDMLGWDKLGDHDWLLKLTAVVFAIPLILWEMQHPQPLSLLIGKTGLIFHFVNQDYAVEFAQLNGVDAKPGRHPA